MEPLSEGISHGGSERSLSLALVLSCTGAGCMCALCKIITSSILTITMSCDTDAKQLAAGAAAAGANQRFRGFVRTQKWNFKQARIQTAIKRGGETRLPA